jgi:hypothetical protein
MIKESPTKSCLLDPMPTRILKEIYQTVSPIISDIVKCSIATGNFPNDLKLSLVRPSLKKYDTNSLANYRPIANLSFLSKTIERIIAGQVRTYLDDNQLYPAIQSAYRKFHSTETALLKVSNDILRAVDLHQDVVLVLLDLSAAFDTIDHQILLRRMKDRFGFKGNALHWFQSYLQDRSQTIMIKDTLSKHTQIRCGVTLGPLLFSLYMAPIEDIIRSHDLNGMIYADDSQLYITISTKDRASSLEKLRSCIMAL